LNPKQFAVAGGILIAIVLAGCSDGGRSTSQQGSGSIFEKGKTYSVQLVGLPVLAGEVKLTVVEVGPYPWVKVKTDGYDSGPRWLNVNHFLSVQEASDRPATTSSVAKH
jgi:hypothetical protein